MSHPELNIYFPMVRAAVRSMDCMTEFMKETFETNTDKFILIGASKRGWTSWLTAAMDPERVEGFIPLVWDAINFESVFMVCYKLFFGVYWQISSSFLEPISKFWRMELGH